MATRDPVLDELRRSMSLSATSSRKTGIGLAGADSTISLEGLEQADIGESMVAIAWCTYEAREGTNCVQIIVNPSSIVAHSRAAEEWSLFWCRQLVLLYQLKELDSVNNSRSLLLEISIRKTAMLVLLIIWIRMISWSVIRVDWSCYDQTCSPHPLISNNIIVQS